jgi:branched-chain amino acid transport system permease protein
MEVFGVPLQAVTAQMFIGLVNGSFYAMLSLGLAVIFGLLNVVNFAHGALYMMGAFVAWMALAYLGVGYWWALLLSPMAVGAVGVALERGFIRRLYKLDPVYGLLLTFGLSLVIQGGFRQRYGVSGLPYSVPDLLRGSTDLGFMRLPDYRAWVVFASLTVGFATWLVIEKTRLGATLRAGMENPQVVQAFGINLPRIVMLTYGFGAALAAFAGVLAAPIMQVGPLMGGDILITVFAVVVVGGMGSIAGAIVTGLLLGVVEALCKVYYPPASNIVVFVIMAVVLLFRPAGLFGQRT